jgi:hypothetical protein
VVPLRSFGPTHSRSSYILSMPSARRDIQFMRTNMFSNVWGLTHCCRQRNKLESTFGFTKLESAYWSNNLEASWKPAHANQSLKQMHASHEVVSMAVVGSQPDPFAKDSSGNKEERNEELTSSRG